MVAAEFVSFSVPDGVSMSVAPEKKSFDAVTVTAFDACDAVD
jgi:hypothetical protein